MNIRKARHSDIGAIADLFWELDAHMAEFQPEHFRRAHRSTGFIAAIMEDEKADFLVAEADGEVAGFVLLLEKEIEETETFLPCKYAFIQGLVVKEKFRNQKIGTSLLEETKKWASARKLGYVKLSVMPTNADARRFYARHGFYEQIITMELPTENEQKCN